MNLILEVPITTTWSGSKRKNNNIRFSAMEGVDQYKILC